MVLLFRKVKLIMAIQRHKWQRTQKELKLREHILNMKTKMKECTEIGERKFQSNYDLVGSLKPRGHFSFLDDPRVLDITMGY